MSGRCSDETEIQRHGISKERSDTRYRKMKRNYDMGSSVVDVKDSWSYVG